MLFLCQLCIRVKSAVSGSHAPNLSSTLDIKAPPSWCWLFVPSCLRAHLNPSVGCPFPFGPSPPCLPFSTRTLQHASPCPDLASVMHCVQLACWIVQRSSGHVLPWRYDLCTAELSYHPNINISYDHLDIFLFYDWTIHTSVISVLTFFIRVIFQGYLLNFIVCSWPGKIVKGMEKIYIF